MALQIPNIDWEDFFKVVRANGGDWADLFWERNEASTIGFKDKEARNFVAGRDEGAGLRVLCEGRSVYAFTNDVSTTGLYQLARQISASVKSTHKDSTSWTKKLLERNLDFKVSKIPSEASFKEKLDLLRRLDAALWADKVVEHANTDFSEFRRQIFVARSDGTLARDDKSSVTMVASAGAESGGLMQMARDQIGGFWGLERFEVESPEALAKKCVDQLKVLLKAVPAPSGTMPVVLSAEAGGTMIHEAVGHGLEADLAEQGLSVYAGRLGQKVAASIVSVVDDGTLPFMRGSHGIDDEANPTQRTLLIENGVLKNYMVDQKMSLKLGRPSTGNGRRQTYRHEPMVRMTNTFICPGKDDPAAILKDTPHGIFVRKMGGGQVDTVSGNFVFQVTEAYMIKNGELGQPIRDATLTGNGPKILEQIDKIGNDLGWANGTCGKNGQGAPVSDAQPTIRIPQIVVGGQ